MLATVGMGHNSAGYGQMLKPAKPSTPKPPKPRFPYFKFYPRDWIEATRDMSLEQRGAYIDLICLIMEMEGHLADNDKWISHQMHVSTRKWQTVKKQLVAHEKIRIDDGKIVNERCLKELDALLSQRRNLSGSALARERTKRDSIVSQPRTDDEKSEKTNENNGPDTTVVPLRALASDLDSDKEKKKEDKPAPTEQGAACGPQDAIGGLNDATTLIVEKLAGWINPMTPDKRTAKGWLDSSVAMFGGTVVRDSFAEVEAKVMQGDIIARPIPLLTKICQQKAAARQSGSARALPPWEIAESEKLKREEDAMEQMREYQRKRQALRELGDG